MTPPLPKNPATGLQPYLSSPSLTQNSGEVFRKLVAYKETIDINSPQWADLMKKFDQLKVVTTSAFAARYLQPLQNWLFRIGAPGALTGAVSTLATPVSALSAAELAGPVGLAAVGGIAMGCFLNEALPSAGGAIGDWAFDTFGPAESSSWIWKLDGAFTRAFDNNATVRDLLAEGVTAAMGPAGSGTISALDHLGFGGWNAFKNAWGK